MTTMDGSSNPQPVVALVLRFNDAFNTHDVAAMMALTTPDTVFENTSPAPDGTRYAGQEAVRAFWTDFFRASPSARIDIEEITGLGEHCVMRWTYTWRDGAGQRGHVRGVDVFQMRDGKIAQKLSYVKG
jgi:steroid delta-isomerase-like uncharacterized protein